MNLTEIANLRLINQLIARKEFTNPKDVASWMGGMQAQDYGMAKWAIGLRLQNFTDKQVETAMENGEIIRIHVLRPTWQFISADDVYWMLGLTSPHIKASIKSRHIQLGLSESILSKSNRIIENALRGGKQLTREDLLLELGRANIPLTENRASHLFVWAELEGIICSGATKGGKLTYAMLDERVSKGKSWTHAEALANLARKYFSSHGPATLSDFVWWSGLSVHEARHALEYIDSEFASEEINGHRYWFKQIHSFPRVDPEDVYLLPAYDELLIGYADRSAVLHDKDFKKTVSNNGIFRPTIVVNGQIVGIWKRTIKREKVIVETAYFNRPGISTRDKIEKVLLNYGDYLGKEIEVITN